MPHFLTKGKKNGFKSILKLMNRCSTVIIIELGECTDNTDNNYYYNRL